jgi:hypothetical protein
LERHSFLTILVAFLIPPECRLCEKKRDTLIPFTLNNLKVNDFRTMVITETERDVGVAEKKASKGLIKEAKKVLLHTIRMLIVSSQLVRNIRTNQTHAKLDLWGDLAAPSDDQKQQTEYEARLISDQFHHDWSMDWQHYTNTLLPLIQNLREGLLAL